MKNTIFRSDGDFAGFVDGFQARNLASIENNIAVQLSEMQTRLVIITGLLEATTLPNKAAVVDSFSSISQLFKTTDNDKTIIDHLISVGESLKRWIADHGKAVLADTNINAQVKGFILAYVSGAEASHNDNLVSAAVGVAKDYHLYLQYIKKT
jgi:hypothetical protein